MSANNANEGQDMASIVKQPNGHWWVQFVSPDKKRKTIRLGKTTEAKANEHRQLVESLVKALKAGKPISQQAALCVAELEDGLHDRYYRAGLVGERKRGPEMTVGLLVDEYIAGRPDVKPQTKLSFEKAGRSLRDYFTADKTIASLTEADGEKWVSWMLTKGNVRDKGKTTLAVNTVRKRCGVAKQFLHYAVRSGYLAKNPFKRLNGQTRSNKARQCFVDRETIYKVMDHCPSDEWRLVAAFARFAGLRIPTEIYALRWEDVDFAAGSMRIHSEKLEHHESAGIRECPIFPELRPYLEEAKARAIPGEPYVIADREMSGARRRKVFGDIIRKAGIEPWPKRFHNLRASRMTELMEQGETPKAVSIWLGASIKVIMEHYAQVTKGRFRSATEKVTGQTYAEYQATRSNTRSTNEDSLGDGSRTEGSEDGTKPGDIREKDILGAPVRQGKLGGTGLEPVTSTV